MKFIIEYWNGHGWSYYTEAATLVEALQGLDQFRGGASAGARLIIVVAEYR